MTDELEIKGLHEATGSDPEFVRRLRNTILLNRLRLQQTQKLIKERGGNIHGVDRRATAKRRAARKASKKARQKAR